MYERGKKVYVNVDLVHSFQLLNGLKTNMQYKNNSESQC